MATSLLVPRVGIDFAWESPPPSPAALKAAGVTFVCRYLSNDASKDLSPAEYAAYQAAGIAVVVVWETVANRMLAGYSAGKADALEAVTLCKQIGIPGAFPVYFACDFDATQLDQAGIDAYLDGVASVIGVARAGIYGGYWPVSRAFAAGKVTFGWQTYAWSGGSWEPRAQLRQVQNDVTVAGITVDIDHAIADNFGQVIYTPPPPVTATSGTQEGWRHCDKCQVLYWGPGVAGSACPRGGMHYTRAGEYNYPLPWKLP